MNKEDSPATRPKQQTLAIPFFGLAVSIGIFYLGRKAGQPKLSLNKAERSKSKP